MILRVISSYEQQAESRLIDHGGIRPLNGLELRIEHSADGWGYDILRWYQTLGWLRVGWTMTTWGARLKARRYRRHFGTAGERFVEDA